MIAFVKQAAAGLLMEKELEYLTKVTRNPARPCIAILGGAKVSDKIEVIENLMKIVDTAADRRRDGVHVSAGARRSHREIAGGRRQDRPGAGL